jgi:hypothetical protein
LTLPLFGPPNVDRLIVKGDVSGLIDALEYPMPWRVRRDAALALGAMGGADAVGPLIAALGDEHASVRLAATEALGRIGDRGAVEHLIGVLGSGSRASLLPANGPVPNEVPVCRGEGALFGRRQSSDVIGYAVAERKWRANVTVRGRLQWMRHQRLLWWPQSTAPSLRSCIS